MASCSQISVMAFLTSESFTPNQVYLELVHVFGDDSPYYEVVKYWCDKFKSDRKALVNAMQIKAMKEIDDESVTTKIMSLIKENPKIPITHIALVVGLSITMVCRQVRKQLGLRKLMTTWVLHFMPEELKEKRIEYCKAASTMFNNNKNDFCKCVLTVDEISLFTCDLEPAYHAKESDQSKNAMHERSRDIGKKVLATVWWDFYGIVLLKFIEDGSSINEDEHRSQINEVDAILRKERFDRPRKPPLLICNYEGLNYATGIKNEIEECRWQMICHPRDSPDIAPCDYFLFKKLKKSTINKIYDSLDELKADVRGFFKEKKNAWYADSITELPKRWKRVIDGNGFYI